MLIAGARGSPASNTPQASLAATLQVFVTFADTDFVTSVSRQAGSISSPRCEPRRKFHILQMLGGGSAGGVEQDQVPAGGVVKDLKLIGGDGKDLKPAGCVGQDVKPVWGVGQDLELAEDVGQDLNSAGDVAQGVLDKI